MEKIGTEKEKTRLNLADTGGTIKSRNNPAIKKVISHFENRSLSLQKHQNPPDHKQLSLWELIHADFKEKAEENDDNDFEETYPLSDKKGQTCEVYTTEKYSFVHSVTLKFDPYKKGEIIYRLNTRQGKIMPFNYHYTGKNFCSDEIKNDEKGYGGHVVYGDTDSVFTKFYAPQFEDMERKIAYNMICGSYVADRITEYLRSFNIYKADGEKWTNLEYEKVYGMLLLFSKKRYAGTLFETNPMKFSYIDKKGVALKRRDFCILVKEVYYDCLKILFDEDLGKPRKRLELAIERAQKAIDDLLQHRIPMEKLELSNLLNDEYKMREQKVKKGKKTNTFSEDNIFLNDMVVFEHPKYGLIEGKVVAKRDFDKQNFFNRTEYKKPLDVYCED